MFRSLFIALLVFLASFPQAYSQSAQKPASKILANYGAAIVAETPPMGWQFFSTAGHPLNASAKWELLQRDPKTLMYTPPAGAGTTDGKSPHFTKVGDIFGYKDPAGSAQFAVATFTIPEDTEGQVWINNGNLLNKSFSDGVTLNILLNDQVIYQKIAAQGTTPLIFQKGLGKLKKGDRIQVAVGPPEAGRSGTVRGGRLRFQIEEHIEDGNPPAPLNLLSPGIAEAGPQYEQDGTFAAYAGKHASQQKEVITKKPELIFLGDSITARWPQELLDEHFGNHRPVNLGVGGDWIQNVRWRIENGSLDQAPVRVAVLLIGTNNITARFSPQEIASGIRSLTELIKTKCPQAKVLVLGILPRGESIRDEKSALIPEINRQIAAIADNQTVFYLDVGPSLVEADGTILQEVMPDRLHVAMPGYLRWMEAMKPELQRILALP